MYKDARTLSIMPTFGCNAACKDCGTLSNPFEKEKLSLETILGAIDQAKKLNFLNVVFTGGEATLRWKDLLATIEYANSHNFPTRLVTNAHWARSDSSCEKRISELIEAGLQEINFSTGDEHIKFVPINNVARALKEAINRGLLSAVMIELRKDNKINRQTFLANELLSENLHQVDKLFTVHESPWMPISPYSVSDYPDGSLANNENISTRGGCESLLQTYVLQPNGNIGSCCGLSMRIIPELNTSKINSDSDYLLQAINKSESDFLKMWIHYKGPEKILQWANKLEPRIQWENMYAHKCQACFRVYKDPLVRNVIKNHYKEMFSEVIMSAFIDEAYLPNKLSELFATR